MKHLYSLIDAQLQQPSIVTIGVFDGVHMGHQYLIQQLVNEAHAQGWLAVVLTFFPHPDVVLRGLRGRYYLTTPEKKADLLADLGVDCVVTQTFDESLRHVRAEAYVDQLCRELQMRALWVGSDFAMGYEREGDVAFLKASGEQKGFALHEIDLMVAQGTETISSTAIRDTLLAGDMEAAKALLGRPYSVKGEVVHGLKRGRTIGYPTANTAVWDEQVLPVNGVYAGWAQLGEERFMAMTNVGVSPHFDGKQVTVEPYLLDFDRDIYGQQLEVFFEKRLRPEARFDSLQGLIDQIGRDVETGRQYLQSLEAQSGLGNR